MTLTICFNNDSTTTQNQQIRYAKNSSKNLSNQLIWDIEPPTEAQKQETKELLAKKAKEDKMLNEKASNGLTYKEAKEIMTKLYKNFRKDPREIKLVDFFKYFVEDKELSRKMGVCSYSRNRETLEADPEYAKAKAACAELEAKYPSISECYERRYGRNLKVNMGIGFAEIV